MGQAEDEIVAWPADRVVLLVMEHSEEDNVVKITSAAWPADNVIVDVPLIPTAIRA